MIRHFIRAIITLAGVGVILYGVFFVPLGERTMYQHLSRVAGTDEAQDLGRELGEAGDRLEEEARRRIEEAIDDGGVDAADAEPDG